MPKVIIIGPAHPLRGGLALFNERLAKAFQELNWECKIYTFSLQYPKILFPGKTQFSNETAPPDLEIKVSINSINPVNWIVQGLKIKNENADLVICRYWLPFMSPCFSTLIWLIKKNKKSKTICIVDNLIPHEKRTGDAILTALFINKPDAFVCMSETVQQDLLKLKPDVNQMLIDHPVPDSLGPAIPMTQARKHLGLPGDKKLVLFFGFIRAYKGLDLAIRAMHKLYSLNPDIHLVVAGEFYEDESRYKELIEELQLHEQIHLFNHFIDDSEVKYYFSACDLVVQPYRSATQSGVTPLAYFFEKPSLVTRVGSLARLVPDGLAGFVCEPEPDSIASGILKTIAQDQKKFKAYLGIEKLKYNWEAFTTKLIRMVGLHPD